MTTPTGRFPDIASRYDCFLFDLDGTLYRGEAAIPGAAAAVSRLRADGRAVVFMTNNSSRTPEVVADTLVHLGFEAAASEVVTSSVVTAQMLRAEGVDEVFVVGEEGIRAALRAEGIAVVDEPAEPDEVACVVVGWDRAAHYDSLRRAGLLVQRGARLVATNADAAFPSPDGLWPGTGALLSVITTTTGAVPTIVGKPHPPIFHAALAAAGGGRPLVIGDRLDTDIEGANRLGWDTALVLSGITELAAAKASPIRATWVLGSLAELFDDRIA